MAKRHPSPSFSVCGVPIVLEEPSPTQDERTANWKGNEFSFPLSFLLGLMSFAAVFFATWRLSHEIALIGTAVVSPIIVRTVWLCEQAVKEGKPLSWQEKLNVVLSSFLMVVGAVLCFVVVFTLLAGLIVLAGMGLGFFTRGADGASEGAVIGAVIGLLVGGGGAMYITAWLIQLMWRGQSRSNEAVAG